MPAAVWMLLSVVMFSTMDVTLKVLAPHYPAMELACLRGVASLPFVLLWIARTTPLAGLRMVNVPLHLVRGLLGVGLMWTFIRAVAVLPLATAYAVYFVAPLLIAMLSGLLLGERVGWRRWVAVVVGLCGVLLILRPGVEGLSLGVFWALGAALCYALMAVTVRRLTRTDTPQSMVVWFLLLLVAVSFVLALPEWQPLRAAHLGWLLVMGLTGALGQVAVTYAFRNGEVSAIAPLEYAGLLCATLFDRVLWDVRPEGMTLLGAAVIIASGLFLLLGRRR